jgi:predicted DsbA family dithiol-disulfide isomerase
MARRPTVRVYSDFICPYCYVGLARTRWLKEDYGADVTWLPFDLHPEYPPEGMAREDLDAKYGGEPWREGLIAMFEEEGLPASRDVTRVPNSMKALRVTELARTHGCEDAVHERLFDAYWARALDIGEDDVLVAEAVAAGLPEDEVRHVLRTNRYADVVQAHTTDLLQTGATGVPAFVVDERVLVPGAAAHEAFERVLDRLGYAPVRV